MCFKDRRSDHDNLEEHDTVVGLAHLLEVRGDHLAGAAPGRKEVHNHQLAAGRLQLGVEVSQVLDRVNHLEE